MQQIERGIFYQDSYLGVTLGALVFVQGVILIDAPLRAEDARSWRSAIINQRGGPNRLLVSLDAHPDRTLGTRALDCTIIAHQKSAQIFRSRPMIFKGQSVESGAIWETYTDAIGLRWASPDITFTDRMYLHWGGPEVILEYQPGPTLGSIWVIIPDAGVVFVGDSVVPNQPPFLAQADIEAWRHSLDYLINAYRNFVIISGRGGPVAIEQVRFQQKILKAIDTGMEKLAVKGSPPEATQQLASTLMPKFKASSEWKDLYSRRLHFGLYQCYARRYRMNSVYGQLEMGEEEP